MKKYLFILIPIVLSAFSFSSCQDLMEADSDRQVYDPALDQKTDSIFYTLGILKGLQQVADQYVLVNEMRGDLTTTNSYTSTSLRELADFSAGTSNAYDSAYVYYRIINNCNYYIAHRDTTLLTGSHNVSMAEYVEAKAVRAWTYLQLAKIYGSVPFFTYPITSISSANQDIEKKDLVGICNALIPDLLQYTSYDVPDYGDISAGSTNSGETKTVTSSKAMLPVYLVLGDLYLESNQYQEAAQCYFNYLKAHKIVSTNYWVSPYNYPDVTKLPNDLSLTVGSSAKSWSSIFSISSPNDIITYIPMAVNSLRGTITNLPELFGYDFYTTTGGSQNSSARYLLKRQIDPSATYLTLSNSQNYYYVPSGSSAGNQVNSIPIGDMRRYITFSKVTKDDSTFNVMTKFNSANIPVYRETTVYLRLAEALNRMGYPDAAFAILKDGINTDLLSDTTYMRQTAKDLLLNTVPFLSTENQSIFANNYGIHSHGCGYTKGSFSPYQYTTILDNKWKELVSKDAITLPDSVNYYGPEAIDAMEDVLCDEYALELGFEGSRFGDLTRIARHKNEDSTYGTNYGGRWIARKLSAKHPVVDLKEEKNWFLPLK